MSKFFTVKKLSAMGLLIALYVIFARVLSLNAGHLKISLGFLPICVAGMVFGPLGGGITGVLADIIGMLIFSRGDVYFPLFTVSEFLYGFGYGLMLRPKKYSPLKLSIFVIIQFVILNLLVQSLWLYLYNIFITGNPKGYIVLLTGRLMTAVINLPMQVIVINLVAAYLKKPLMQFIDKI